VAFGIERWGLRVSAAAMTTWQISLERSIKDRVTHGFYTDKREAGIDERADKPKEMSC